MTKYETAILFDTELPEDQRKELVSKLVGIVASYQGEVVKQDDWGVRRLSYPIRKKTSAYYTFLVYTGSRGVVEEMERNLKIFDGALRYMSTKASVKAAPQAAQQAQAETQGAQESSPAADEAPPAPPAS